MEATGVIFNRIVVNCEKVAREPILYRSHIWYPLEKTYTVEFLANGLPNSISVTIPSESFYLLLGYSKPNGTMLTYFVFYHRNFFGPNIFDVIPEDIPHYASRINQYLPHIGCGGDCIEPGLVEEAEWDLDEFLDEEEEPESSEADSDYVTDSDADSLSDLSDVESIITVDDGYEI